jgi:hypothetical protein
MPALSFSRNKPFPSLYKKYYFMYEVRNIKATTLLIKTLKVEVMRSVDSILHYDISHIVDDRNLVLVSVKRIIRHRAALRG